MDDFEKNDEIIENNEIAKDDESVVEKTNWKKEAWEWAQAIGLALIIAIIVRTFFFTLVLVDGPSMEPTLHTGDRLFVYKLMYHPQDKDVVVFTPENYPNKPFIKRIIALPGQTVDIDFARGKVMVDGKVLDEPYINVPTTRKGSVDFPVTVPKGYFFAMGDNRGNSHDCRDADVGDTDNQMGMVSEKRLMGKALFRLWPLSKFGSLYK